MPQLAVATFDQETWITEQSIGEISASSRPFVHKKRNDGPEAMKMTVAPQIAQVKQLGETQRDHILRQKQ